MTVFLHDGLALGEWLPEWDRSLSWACEQLFDRARIETALRPYSLAVFPARGARWAGMAAADAIDLRSDVARALACPQIVVPMPRAPAIVLHEAGHTAMFRLAPAALSARLAAVAPTLAAGWHDPIFAAIVGVFYQRAGLLDVQINSYDCGWSSEDALDWPGPDWALDWAHNFSQRHSADAGDVATLVRAAIAEFESEFFARAPAWWQWWRRSGNAFVVAANYRRHR